MTRLRLIPAALVFLAVSCSGTPPSTPPPQPTEPETATTPTAAATLTSTPPVVLPGLTLEGNEVMWSGDPPPISNYRVYFCDDGILEGSFVPLSGLALPAYVSEDIGEARTIRRAEADGDGFSLSVERECPIPPTPTQEIACTLEAVDEYLVTVSPLIGDSNDDLQQYVSMLPGLVPYQAEYIWDSDAYGEIIDRHLRIDAQLRALSIPPCLREVHDATLTAMGYRFSAYNALAGLPRPDPARLQAWLEGVYELVDQTEAHMHRAGDLMAALLLEEFGLSITPTP